MSPRLPFSASQEEPTRLRKSFCMLVFMDVEPIVLEGTFVRLEPLSMDHLDAFCEAGLDESIWRWGLAKIGDRGQMRRYIETALGEQRRGIALPFATVDRASVRIIGSTRFGNIDTSNRRVEIGWTWVSPPWQRTYVNTEAKLLMLTHAFEVWKCIRVELKTDALNERSQNAILRLGAKQEGILRNHLITDTGRFRDSVIFSIISDEWDGVRARLEKKLTRSPN